LAKTTYIRLNGRAKRFVELLTGKKKVVAASGYSSVINIRRINCSCRRLGIGAIYIYPVLMKEKMTRKKERQTILVIGAGLAFLYFITKQQHITLLLGCIAVTFLGLSSRLAAAQIVWAWFKLAEMLGMISSTIILTIVFFFILFPIATLSRLFGRKSNLQLAKKPDAISYYITRNHRYKAKDLENTW